MCNCNKLKITKSVGKAAKDSKPGKPAKVPLRKKIKLPKK